MAATLSRPQCVNLCHDEKCVGHSEAPCGKPCQHTAPTARHEGKVWYSQIKHDFLQQFWQSDIANDVLEIFYILCTGYKLTLKHIENLLDWEVENGLSM